jgi:hypothetical protein
VLVIRHQPRRQRQINSRKDFRHCGVRRLAIARLDLGDCAIRNARLLRQLTLRETRFGAAEEHFSHGGADRASYYGADGPATTTDLGA